VFNHATKIHAKISPDPAISGKSITFSVSGRLNHDIADNGLVSITFFDESGSRLGNSSRVPAPSTKAGNIFRVNAKLDAPTDLPNSYSMQVLVVNPSILPDPQKDIIGCIAGFVGTPNDNSTSNKNVISKSFFILS
ncbi:15852_t:CDS:2, partial [Cetraspora pellucida]